MQKQVNMDLKYLYHWLLANKISLNCAKTEFIFFKREGQEFSFEFKIKMNGVKISPSKQIKYLGIFLDSHLNGDYHCKLLLNKLKRANGMLCKARHYVPSHEIQSIYHAIFASHMIYGCQVWGQSVNVHTEKIFKIQNRAMRIISFADFHSNADPIYKTLNILKLNDFISMQNCLFVYDDLNENLPSCFDNYFKSIHEVHTLGTRASNLGCLFTTQINTTKYGLNSITRKCIDSWNFFTNIFKCNLKAVMRRRVEVAYFGGGGGRGVCKLLPPPPKICYKFVMI